MTLVEEAGGQFGKLVLEGNHGLLDQMLVVKMEIKEYSMDGYPR